MISFMIYPQKSQSVTYALFYWYTGLPYLMQEITQEHEKQEVGSIEGHLGGWLPQNETQEESRMCGSSMDLWRAVITSHHPVGSPERTGQREDFGPWVIQSRSALHIAQGKVCMETWIRFRGPDFFRLGPWMLVSGCQYISLVGPAINEGKSRGSSESKKGVTTWPEEDDQGTGYQHALRNLLPLLNGKSF